MAKLPSTVTRNFELSSLWISIFFSALADFVSTWSSGNIRAGFPYLIALACVTMFVWRFWEKSRPAVWKGKVFHGVRNAWDEEGWTAWARQSDAERVVKALSVEKPVLHVLCGASGAGKSVLVASQVVSSIELRIPTILTISVKIYTPIDAKLSDLRVQLIKQKDRPQFLIFDQIERLINLTSAEQRAWVGFINECLIANVKCMAIVRDDFFYQLRFLGQLLPSPSDAIHLQGIEPAKSQDFNQVKKDFDKVADEHCLEVILQELQANNLRSDGSTSPLELQIIGMMLEKHSDEEGPKVTLERYRQKLRSTNDILRSYFAMYIEASPNPMVTQSILFALSTDTRLRRSLDRSQLSSIVYQDRASIRSVVDFLEDNNLIVSHDKYEYEFAHDQLAAGFREYAFTEVLPEIRDNISYNIEKRRTLPAKNNILAAEDIQGRIIFWNIVFIILLIGTTGRCLFSRWTGWYVLNGIGGDWISIHSHLYLFAGATHLVGALYTVALEREIFIRVRSELCLFPWWLFPCLGLILMGGTWWVPNLWITAVGVMAIALGIHRLAITWRIHLPKQAKWRLSKPGALSAASGVIVSGIGLYYALKVVSSTDSITALLFTSVMMIGGFISITYGMRQHLDSQSIEAILGTIDRANIKSSAK